MNRNQRALLFTENGMACIADADLAMNSLRARVRGLCYKPTVTLDDIDGFTTDLATVEAGLAAGRRALQAERATVE